MRNYSKKNPHKISEQNKKYKQKNNGRNYKNSVFKCAFGITLEKYEKFQKEQQNRCAICNQEETATNQYGIKNLAVDHNHSTGRVRGLLCAKCNMALGLLNEDISIMSKMITYISER